MRKYRADILDGNDDLVCGLREAYADWAFDVEDLIRHPRLSFEKSPSYMVAFGVPYSIRRVTPWTKVIITLRNPIDRLWSQYQMRKDRKQQKRELERSLAHELSQMQYLGNLIPPNATAPFEIPEYVARQKDPKLTGLIYRGMYSHQLKRWLKHFELGVNLLVIQFEKLQSSPQQVMNEVLEFVRAPPYTFDPTALTHDHSPTKGRRSRRNDTEYMADSTRAYLEEFYSFYNAELVELLGPTWADAWVNGSTGGRPPTPEELEAQAKADLERGDEPEVEQEAEQDGEDDEDEG
jgi:hypothetical protein